MKSLLVNINYYLTPTRRQQPIDLSPLPHCICSLSATPSLPFVSSATMPNFFFIQYHVPPRLPFAHYPQNTSFPNPLSEHTLLHLSNYPPPLSNFLSSIRRLRSEGASILSYEYESLGSNPDIRSRQSRRLNCTTFPLPRHCRR